MLKANLNDVLRAIAKQLSLEPKSLIKYAQEAPHAATRPDGNLPWPSGTGSENEKRILYAITKARQPMFVIDIGTRWGACTLQMLSAVKPAYFITIDVEETIHGGKQPVGKFIPDDYKYDQLTVDAPAWMTITKEHADLIFEDTAHDYDTTYGIYRNAERVLNDGGIIISHDAAHPKFRDAIIGAIKANGIEPEVYLVEGDSCGLAIWQKPKNKIEVQSFGDLDAVFKNKDDHEWQGIGADIKPGHVEQPTPIHIVNPPRRTRRKSTKRKKESAL